jgi:hypothetical protein
LQGFDVELRAEDVDALLLEEGEREEVCERRSGLVGRLVPTEFRACLIHPLSINQKSYDSNWKTNQNYKIGLMVENETCCRF